MHRRLADDFTPPFVLKKSATPSSCVTTHVNLRARRQHSAQSESMAPGGAPAKHIPPKPPDRGSFPLDHFRECSDSKKTYILCLKEHDMQAEDCRHLAGAYLQCRMDTCAGATTSHAPYLWA